MTIARTAPTNGAQFEKEASSLDPADWSADFAALRHMVHELPERPRAMREAWYDAQVSALEPKSVEARAVKHATEFGRHLKEKLASPLMSPIGGESSVTLTLMPRYGSISWKYANWISSDQVRHAVWDLSLRVEEYQARLRAAAIVQQLVVEAGGSCEIIRVPAGCKDCFLEELHLKASLTK